MVTSTMLSPLEFTYPGCAVARITNLYLPTNVPDYYNQSIR